MLSLLKSFLRPTVPSWRRRGLPRVICCELCGTFSTEPICGPCELVRLAPFDSLDMFGSSQHPMPIGRRIA